MSKKLIAAGVIVTGTLLYVLLSRKATAQQQMRYSCLNNTCIGDINGMFATPEECQVSCAAQSQTFDVIINEP